MKRVVIESPCAARDGWNRQHHLKYARLALRDSLSRGEAPIASHLLYPRTAGGPLNDLVPEERHQGIYAGLAWAAMAELAVFYVAMGESPGMAAAREFYRDNGIPTADRLGKWMPCRHCRMSGWEKDPRASYKRSRHCRFCCPTGTYDGDVGLGVVLVQDRCREKCCEIAAPKPTPPDLPVR